MNRRHFLTSASLGVMALPQALSRPTLPPRLVILHTNDMHSRLDPFPMDGGRFQGLGGVARRASLIEQVRKRNKHVLLLDSGDIFQGTPYYNLYGGVPELKAMTQMGYDVATVGNHEFDNGVDALAKVLPHGKFDWVSTNLDWSQSALSTKMQPWAIKELGPFRVGLFGLLCRLEGMVAPNNHEGVRYLDPVASARRVVSELKARGCNLIVCLSHLGYRSSGPGDEIRDDIFPERVEGIDIILGGHSHTFIDELEKLPRKGGGTTYITQQGWGGVRLGRIDVALDFKGFAMTQSPLSVSFS